MRRWFLSYNSQDFQVAQALEAELKSKDTDATIFFAPKSLRPGAYWMPALAKEIAEATAFVLLIGQNGLGPWQVIEYYEAYGRRAKQHDFPVILVLLHGQPAPGLPFLRQLHWIVTADPASEKTVAQVLDATSGGGAPAGELWRHTSPYRGLYAMTESDADFFFGRDRETVEAIGALAAVPDKLPVLLGNSGVGKSSLAQGGVLAALMRETELREVVSRPATILSARFETDRLASHIARRAAEESARDAGALPLLSYLLDDMWTKMVQRGDGVLRLPAQAIDIGAVLIERADTFLAAHPKFEDELRRIFTLRLATVREDGEATRRRAFRSEFSVDEWRLVCALADHPNRLLITATSVAGESYAEVAHEAIFRRWDKLREWVVQEREFLIWKSGLETDRRSWESAPADAKTDTLLMGFKLAQAQRWLARHPEDLSKVDREFIDQSCTRREQLRQRARRVRALVYVLLVGIITGLVAWINRLYFNEQINWFMTMRPYMLKSVRPYVLTTQAERALQPKTTFKECEKYCPEMVVVPAGVFTMGSPAAENGRDRTEGPLHTVTIAKPFAVSKFLLTFSEWDGCVSVGGCPPANDSGYGRFEKPVINVTWVGAQQYVAWLSKMTGQSYRLLTEAEWEYAARAGSTTAYFWGDEIGRGNANCNGCGSDWDNHEPSPVGKFKQNEFGLFDMHGNVWEWVEDCYHGTYNGAPADGSSWTTGDCGSRVVRGGSWLNDPLFLRSAARNWNAIDVRFNILGFRVARTLTLDQ